MPSFVAIDVETANSFMGSICQIGAVRFEHGVEVESVSWLIDPQCDFDGMNISIHGITPEMVAGQPSFNDRHQELFDLTKERITVCHTHFDWVAFRQACAHAKMQELNCRWLDSAKVARRTWPDVARTGYGLSKLAKRFDIKFQHHDACEDARAAGLVLLRALEESGDDVETWFTRVQQPIAPDYRKAITKEGSDFGPLSGERICFTGSLKIPRREAAERAASLGAAVADSVNSKTTVLVVGDQDLQKLAGHPKSSKHRKAEKLIEEGQPLRIVAEQDFLVF